MAVHNLGIVKPGTLLVLPFNTFDSNDPSASVTLTGLAVTDIEIYKDGSVTQRASDAGYTLLDTDGIDFDGTTGIHGISIDLANNTTAGFYAAGSRYFVVIASVTVDAGTVNFVLAEFVIGYPGALLDTTIATLASQVSFTLTGGSADNDAYNGCMAYVHDVASAVQIAIGVVSDYTGSSKTVTLLVNPGIFTMATTDNISLFPPTLDALAVDLIMDEVLNGGTHNVVNSLGRRIRELQEAGGYTGGFVYVDTVGGTAGTTPFENGVDTRALTTVADMNTIAASVGLAKFQITSGSSLTLDATQANQEFMGVNWTLVLNNQSLSGSHIQGADVTGIATGANEFHFDHCEMGDCTLAGCHLDQCDIEGTIILSDAASYFIINCASVGASIIDFGAAIGNTTVHIQDYSGEITIKNMGQTGTDVLHFDSPGGKLTLDSTCVGGTVNMNGTFEFVNNGSGMTINKGGAAIDFLSVTGVVLATGAVDAVSTATDYLAEINAEVDTALNTAIPGSPTAASINEVLKRLNRSAGVIQEFTIDNTSFTATTTQAQVDAVDIGSLEATDDHYIGRIMIFTITGATGRNNYQATDITDYDGTNKRFTYTALTDIPNDNDTFIIV